MSTPLGRVPIRVRFRLFSSPYSRVFAGNLFGSCKGPENALPDRVRPSPGRGPAVGTGGNDGTLHGDQAGREAVAGAGCPPGDLTGKDGRETSGVGGGTGRVRGKPSQGLH